MIRSHALVEIGIDFWKKNQTRLEDIALSSALIAFEKNVLCFGPDQAVVIDDANRPFVWDIQHECCRVLYEGTFDEGRALQKCMRKVKGVAQVVLAVLVPNKNKSYNLMETFPFTHERPIPMNFRCTNTKFQKFPMRFFLEAAKILQSLSGCGTKFSETEPFVWVGPLHELLIYPSAFALKQATETKDPREALLRLAISHGSTLFEQLSTCSPSDFWNEAIKLLESLHNEELDKIFPCWISDKEMEDLKRSPKDHLPPALEIPIGVGGSDVPGHQGWSVKRLPGRGETTQRFIYRGSEIADGSFKRVFRGVLLEGASAYKVAVSTFKDNPKTPLDQVMCLRRIENELAGSGAAGQEHVLPLWDTRSLRFQFEQISVLYPTDFEKCLESNLLPYPQVIEIMRQASVGLSNFQRATGRYYSDFKPENVLLKNQPDGSYYAALGDLGGSGVPDSDQKGTYTPLYAPPEQVRTMFYNTGRGLGFPFDVWSFGAALLFATTKLTLETETLRDIYSRKRHQNAVNIWIADVKGILDNLPKTDLFQLIRSCLNSDPKERPKTDQLEALIKAIKT